MKCRCDRKYSSSWRCGKLWLVKYRLCVRPLLYAPGLKVLSSKELFGSICCGQLLLYRCRLHSCSLFLWLGVFFPRCLWKTMSVPSFFYGICLHSGEDAEKNALVHLVGTDWFLFSLSICSFSPNLIKYTTISNRMFCQEAVHGSV